MLNKKIKLHSELQNEIWMKAYSTGNYSNGSHCKQNKTNYARNHFVLSAPYKKGSLRAKMNARLPYSIFVFFFNQQCRMLTSLLVGDSKAIKSTVL